MSITIKKVEIWTTSDGVQHPSKEAAEQYVLCHDLIEMLCERCHLNERSAHDVLNLVYSERAMVRFYLDLSEKMLKEVGAS